MVEPLLDSEGVDINKADHLDKSPIFWASLRGHTTVVRMLLETGQVNFEKKTSDGWTPIVGVAAEGHTTIVKMLSETGQLGPDAKDFNKRTPLYWASFALTYASGEFSVRDWSSGHQCERPYG